MEVVAREHGSRAPVHPHCSHARRATPPCLPSTNCPRFCEKLLDSTCQPSGLGPTDSQRGPRVGRQEQVRGQRGTWLRWARGWRGRQLGPGGWFWENWGLASGEEHPSWAWASDDMGAEVPPSSQPADLCREHSRGHRRAERNPALCLRPAVAGLQGGGSVGVSPDPGCNLRSPVPSRPRFLVSLDSRDSAPAN